MAALQTGMFRIFQFFNKTKQLTSLDIRFGICTTQVHGKEVPRPRFRHPLWHLKKERAHFPEHLTPESVKFVDEIITEKFGPRTTIAGVQTFDSPLKNVATVNPIPWYPGIRRTSTIARKIGVYPLWTKDGKRILTTLLQIVDNHVVRYNPPGTVLTHRHREKVVPKSKLNKYGALVVGAESTDPQLFTKEYCGLFKDSGLPPKRILARFLITPEAVLPAGTPLTAMHYKIGGYVDVTGRTVDRGFQGVMKRWGFKGMPATHGVTKTHRRPGNIGSGGAKARVLLGQKMPGHMGNRPRTARGVKILRINTEYNVLWVTGRAIPGETNAVVYIHDCLMYHRMIRNSEQAPPLPTYIPKEADETLPRELWADEMHPFSDPTIAFEVKDEPQVKAGAKTAAKTAKLRQK